MSTRLASPLNYHSFVVSISFAYSGSNSRETVNKADALIWAYLTSVSPQKSFCIPHLTDKKKKKSNPLDKRRVPIVQPLLKISSTCTFRVKSSKIVPKWVGAFLFVDGSPRVSPLFRNSVESCDANPIVRSRLFFFSPDKKKQHYLWPNPLNNVCEKVPFLPGLCARSLYCYFGNTQLNPSSIWYPYFLLEKKRRQVKSHINVHCMGGSRFSFFA